MLAKVEHVSIKGVTAMANSQNTASQTDSAKNGGKEAYAAPKLIEYGTLKDITLVIGLGGISDGGLIYPLERTHLL
ncbi:MAG: lasso RiPP family leader peptide-containing protein [Rhodomicrobium sp.]